MKRYVALSALFIFLAVPLYGEEEGPCEKCRSEANKELAKCIESAISQQDKQTCTEKADERVKSCNQLECKINPEK